MSVEREWTLHLDGARGIIKTQFKVRVEDTGEIVFVLDPNQMVHVDKITFDPFSAGQLMGWLNSARAGTLTGQKT